VDRVGYPFEIIFDEGIIIGGGAAFIRAASKVSLPELTGDQKIGCEIILRAVKAPMKQITSPRKPHKRQRP